jgi:hypothetical protein
MEDDMHHPLMLRNGSACIEEALHLSNSVYIGGKEKEKEVSSVQN